MKDFVSVFFMCFVGIFFFLMFGFGLFNSLWGIIAVAAFLMAAVITAFAELWKKVEELEGRIRALEKMEDGQKRLERTVSRRPANPRRNGNWSVRRGGMNGRNRTGRRS